jgi:hypothetical protein
MHTASIISPMNALVLEAVRTYQNSFYNISRRCITETSHIHAFHRDILNLTK